MFRMPVDCFFPTFSGLKTWFEVSRAKLYRNDLRRQQKLLHNSGRFELSRVRIIGSQLYLVFGENNFFELKLFPLLFKNTKTEFINE